MHARAHTRSRTHTRTHMLTLTRHTTKTSSFYGVQLRAPWYQRRRAAAEIRSRWVLVCETDPARLRFVTLYLSAPTAPLTPLCTPYPQAVLGLYFHALPVSLAEAPRRGKTAGGDAQQGRPASAACVCAHCVRTLACVHQDVPFGVSDGKKPPNELKLDVAHRDY